MTPERFNQCLDALGCGNRAFAAILKRSDRWIRRWSAGGHEIPDDFAAWMEEAAHHRPRDLARYVQQHPPPAWRRPETDDAN